MNFQNRTNVRTGGLTDWKALVMALAVVFNTIGPSLAAETPDAEPPPANAGAEDTTKPSAKPTPDAPKSNEIEAIEVRSVAVDENIMPTSMSSTSTYGLDLGVMETPRNTTMLSHAQLDNVNLQDPRGFSYLTSSAYTDSAFGGPNVPRIRGQEGDVFINGMRSSFTSGGYGPPLSYNSIETIDITKGPASVIAGPGPGVGGSVDFITKVPDAAAFKGSVTGEASSLGVKRWNADFGGPIEGSSLAWRVSYSGEQSRSYFTGHFLEEESFYGVLVGHPSDTYSFQFNSEVTYAHYQEDVGINRVNQALIDDRAYLTGAVPNADIYGFGTVLTLGNPVYLNPKITLDESAGTSALALLYNAQLIQTWQLGTFGSVVNNTFFNYENRDNQAEYYYADSSKGSWTLENRAGVTTKFDWRVAGLNIGNEINFGTSLRFAHVNYISNFSSEPVSAYDLTGPGSSFVFPAANQAADDSVPYVAAMGRVQYGTSGRDSINAGNSSISNLYDAALYFEHRLLFTPELSVLYGARLDLAHANERDPLPEVPGAFTATDLPAAVSTPWYGISNANFSPLYQFEDWASAYLTFDYTQSISGASGDGGVGTYAGDPSATFRQDSRLTEAGLKFSLLNKTLFIGSAVFDQRRLVPAGPNGVESVQAKIRGVETELNYQPNGNVFFTASYSFIRTQLTAPDSFYNFPAYAGTFIDGAASLIVWQPNQSANDPGVPEQTFNLLGNYQFNSGFGMRLGLQATGPIDTTSSGFINVAATNAAAANDGFGTLLGPGGIVPASVVGANGYYQTPRIPWQYTVNLVGYYKAGPYDIKLSIYNLLDHRNWQSSPPYYGNDFLVQSDPLAVDLTVRYKF